MNKKAIIKQINEIITDYGSFSSGELELDSSLCVNSMGNIVALAEYFNKDKAEIEIYDTSSSSSDSISYYNLAYKDMTLNQLYIILKFAKEYKEKQENNK